MRSESKILRSLLLISLFTGLLISSASAEDPPQGAVALPPSSVEPAAPPRASKKTSRPSKGRRPREKEAEGSEARDRFQADTVLKSKYQLNGEPLEVDPD